MTLITAIFGTSILDVMVRFVLIILGILLGVVITTLMTPPTQILRISEKDGRGWELNVNDETPKFLETKSKPPLRFLKFGRSYEFVMGFMRKKVTRFLGKEGTAYTWKIHGFDKVAIECSEKEAEDHIEMKIPILNDEGDMVVLGGATEPAYSIKLKPVRYEQQEINLDFDTIAELLEWKWGRKFFNTIPEKRRKELLDNQVLVTVELENGLTPKGFTPITEQDINDEGDRNFLHLWAVEAKGVLQTPWIQYTFAMGTGGLIVLGAAIMLGYIPVGT